MSAQALGLARTFLFVPADRPERHARALASGAAASAPSSASIPRRSHAVHAALGPGAEELDWARRVVEAVALAGGGVVNLDGRMVDAPVVRLAQRLFALDAQAPPR